MITFYLPAVPLRPGTLVVLLLVLNCLELTGISTFEVRGGKNLIHTKNAWT